MHVMILCGCGASFKRSGIHNHQRQSGDPRCQPVFQSPSISREKCNKVNSDIDLTGLPDAFNIDPTGDFFGDYDDYSLEEFGLESMKETDDITTHEDHETDSEDEDTDSQPEHTQLEPERVPPNPNREASEQIVQDESCTMDTDSGGAFRMRGGAEAELGNKPHIIRFNKGNNAAGRTYPNTNCIDANTLYTAQINDAGNPYSPFRSKLEWEIALWAKMRGPSSTAFTELMSIEGVSESAHTLH